MSDLLIKGMEMPKGCAFCKIKKRNGKKMICPFCDEEWDIRDPMSADHKLENCPLVEVPSHGRLIDADALIAAHKEVCSRSMKFNLDLAPTVIPTNEEGER